MKKLSLEKQIPYYEQFYHMIKQMIFEGKFQPGDRINETQLAREFNVSKSPIREAIRILENEGIVTVENSKVVVYKPTLKDVQDIYFCRVALESFAVKLATNKMTDDEVQQLENVLRETEQAIAEKKEANEIIAYNEKFHRLILQFTNNSHLEKQVKELKGLIYYFRVLNFKGENRAEEILSQHQQIFTYMKKRDDQKAFEEMIRHLEMDTKHLVNVLTEAGIE